METKIFVIASEEEMEEFRRFQALKKATIEVPRMSMEAIRSAIADLLEADSTLGTAVKKIGKFIQMEASVIHLEEISEDAFAVRDARLLLEEKQIEVSRVLATAWEKINHSRLYTEKVVDIEDVVVVAMGYILDIKLMFESLICWNLGMSDPAKRAMSKAFDEATELTNAAVTMLELMRDGLPFDIDKDARESLALAM